MIIGCIDMKRYKIGYVQGTFDMFHIGHLLLIQRAARQCEYLIVGLVSDEFNWHNKKRLPCIPYEDRAAIVAAIGDVDEVVKVEHGQSVIDIWKEHPYDCYFSGDDHVGAGFTNEMKKYGIAVVFFPYTQRISSTKLREKIAVDKKSAVKRKEILFLPYKASMWDSMESVWQAVCRDDDCHATVVAIPYADLNDDGSVRQWNCDADMFPDYVKLTDWQSYDLAVRKPAVIYIHNPYDDGNRITMVEPRFFSRNLRKYTDMLVYIPYFTWTAWWPENHINLACYEHVDKIIVQSPHYKVMGNGIYESDHADLEMVMPAGKIKALGSPKIDRMLQVADRLSLPADWQMKLGKKKTILYNTTVSPLMTAGERGISKMWQVLHVIQEETDLVFIWRPHPLLESMLESQHPELLPAYEKWKSTMLALPQVIYDDTPDLERAVALSDGYIGENSSVAQLFAALGKPIFYNDMMVGEGEENDKFSLAAFSMLIDNGCIYFWAQYWNALCRMDIVSGKVKVLYQNQPSAYAAANYGMLVKIGTHLLLPPANASSLLDYNLQTGMVREIPLENPLEYGNFGSSVVYKGILLMAGSRYGAIAKYDPAAGKIEYIFKAPMEIMEMRSEGHDGFFGGMCVLGDELYVPLVNGNKVLALNLLNYSYRIHIVGAETAAYGHAVAYAENIWLTPRMGGPIAVWNPPTGVMQIFDKFPANFSYHDALGVEETYFFIRPVKCGHYLWLLPSMSNLVMRLDMETGNIENVEIGFPLDKPHSSYYQQQHNCWCGAATEEQVFIWTAADRCIHCLDNNSGIEIACLKPKMSNDEAGKYLHALGKDDFREITMWGGLAAIIEDGINCTQKAFCEYVKSGIHDSTWQKEEFAKLTVNSDGTCGEKIHQYIMKELHDKVGGK